MSQPSATQRRPGFGRGLFIGRLFGIEFYLDLSWFMVATLVTYELKTEIFPTSVHYLTSNAYLGMGIVAALLFFLCILLHELGHSLVSQRCGIPVPRITLLFIGGVAEISREPDDAKSELKIALGGPAVSILLSGFFFAAGWLFQRTHFPPAEAVCLWLSITNLVLVVFNMIPGYPLDGGRVLRALIWHYTGRLRQATFITSRIGIAFSWTLIAIGLLSLLRKDWSGLILLVIGFFLKGAAEAGYTNALQRVVLAGVAVRDIMTRKPVTVPVALPLNLAVDDLFLTNHHVAFPVVTSEGEFRGLLRIEHLKHVPREKWPYVTAGDLVAERDTENLRIDASAPAGRAMRKLLAADSGRLAVTENTTVVGIITRHDILQFIKVHVELEE
jgi:Zn-dependent protease